MKRKFYRLASIVMCLAMALSLMTPAAFAQEECQHDYEGSRNILRAPTCLQGGVAMDICNLCGNKAFLAVPAAHTYNDEADKVEEPTCDAEGVKYWYCTICNPEMLEDGEDVKTEAIPATHTYGEEVDYLLPNCEEAGRFVRACLVCGEYEVLYVNEETAPLGHQTEEVSVDATCQAAGKLIVRCTVCEEVLEETELADQPMLDHEMAAEAVTVVEADCENDGQKAFVCVNYAECGYVFEETAEVIAAVGHTEVIVPAQEATCQDDGVGHKECQVCGVVLEEEVIIPASSQECQKDEKVLRPAACDVFGIAEIYCKVCGANHGYKLIDFVHQEGEAIINLEPTCLEEGEKEYFCALCGISLRKEVIPAAGHLYAEIPELVENCVEGITATLRCTICDDVKQVAFDGSLICDQHNLIYRYEAATCTLPGQLVEACKDCDLEEVHKPHEEDAPLGHQVSDELITLTAPTCTEAGEAAKACTRCLENIEIIVLDPLGHDMQQDMIQNPTCVETGLANEYCQVCGETFAENVEVPALESCTELMVEVLINGDCAHHGIEKQICTICQKESYRIIPAGHVAGEVEITAESTCAAEGKGVIKCLRCEETLEEIQIDCKEHVYAEAADYVSAATCDEGAVEYFCCTECNAEKNLELADVLKIEVGPALGHQMADETTYLPAECVYAGREVKKCTACEYFEVIAIDRNAPATGHQVEYTMEDANCTEPSMSVGACTVCGKVVDAIVVELEGENKPLGHTAAEEWVVVSTATCMEAGLEELHCVTCDYVMETREIPVCECNRVNTLTLVEADCSIGRNQIVMTECEFCHKDMGLRIVPFQHEYLEEDDVIAVEPTCVAAGLMLRTCIACKLVEEVELPMLEHVENDEDQFEIISADCVNPDHIVVRCKACDTILKDDVVENSVALGHVYGVYDPDLGEIVCVYCHEIQPEEAAEIEVEEPAAEEPAAEEAVEIEVEEPAAEEAAEVEVEVPAVEELVEIEVEEPAAEETEEIIEE